MARTTPPPLDPFTGQAPQRGDRATFSPRVDAFVMWMVTAVTQLAAIALNVYNNAVDAFNSATGAATSASNAADSASAAMNSATNAATSATGLTATSTSSLEIGTGNKTFTVQAGKMFIPGIRITAVNPNNTAQSMSGPVVTYGGSTLVMGVDAVTGSGTVATWNLSVTGQRGVAGAAGPAGGIAGGSLTGAINERSVAGLNATSMPDIWNTGGNTFYMNGTATILGYTNAPQGGSKRTWIANGTGITIQSTATHIVYGVPTGTAITLADRDIVDVYAEDVGLFRVTLRRRNGLATVSPAQTLTLLAPATISSPVANIDFLTLFTGDYDYYQIVFANLTQSAANNALLVRVAKAGAVDATSSYVRAGSAAIDSLLLGTADVNGVKAYSGVLEVLGANSDKATLLWRTMDRRVDTNAILGRAESGLYIGTGPLTGFRLFFSAGASFTAGTVRVYGVRNAAGIV